jgi:hypothetical protein
VPALLLESQPHTLVLPPDRKWQPSSTQLAATSRQSRLLLARASCWCWCKLCRDVARGRVIRSPNRVGCVVPSSFRNCFRWSRHCRELAQMMMSDVKYYATVVIVSAMMPAGCVQRARSPKLYVTKCKNAHHERTSDVLNSAKIRQVRKCPM